MQVGLIDVDSKIPNLALMKLSTWHKSLGNSVKLYDPLYDKPDIIYASKVFSYTPDYLYFPEGMEVIKGGSGYDVDGQQPSKLPDGIESICPDYSLYPNIDYSMGFLTRGCIRRCSWCSVWKREGHIKPGADIEQFLRHDKAVLLDNNVLACDWGIKQIEKIVNLGIKVDFNQGLDARLIDDSVAKLLSKVKWLEPVRLACDSKDMMPHIQKAVEALRWHNVTPRRYSCYVLITEDIQDAVDRIRFLKGLDVSPFAQPFISPIPNGKKPTRTMEKLARYTDRKPIFKSTTWEEYVG